MVTCTMSEKAFSPMRMYSLLMRSGQDSRCWAGQTAGHVVRASERPAGVPHPPRSQENTGLCLGAHTGGSLCCELLQHTHRSPRACASCHISEAVFYPHYSKAQRCRRSSLGTGSVDL
jgi:hypothetical protein